MPTLRGKPREAVSLAESKAEIYIKENFASLIGKLNTKFRNEMKDSSAQSTSDESHILYYDPFLKYFIEVAPTIFVSTSDWALSFIQEDLPSTTRQLCHCIHTTDLELRRKLIQKIAVWMMEKCPDENRQKSSPCRRMIDPWSWSPSSEFQETLSIPTQEQIYEINQEIDSFDLRNCGSLPEEDLFSIFEQITATLAPDQLESTLQFSKDDVYDKVFQGFAEFLKGSTQKINPAHVVAALTKCTIPFNNDIFFDAVQFSNNRVTDAAAMAMRGHKHVAIKLCKQILRRDFIQAQKLFVDVQDICPVKRLAIYRAVKFLVNVRKGDIPAKTCDFNSEIEEHNVYPTKEERKEIDEGIRDLAASLFKDARQPFGTEVRDGFSSPNAVTPYSQTSPIQNHNRVPELPTNSLEYEITAWLAQEVTGCQGTTSPQPSGIAIDPDFILPSAATNNFQIPTSSPFPEVAASNFNPTWATTAMNPCPTNYVNNFEPDPVTNFAYKGALNSEPPSNLLDNKMQTNVVGTTPTTEFNRLDNSFAQTPLMAPAQQIATVVKYTCPSHVMDQAKRGFESLGTIKTGKYLFHKLFSHEQKLSCTWGGKNSTPKYPQEIVNVIFDALNEFETEAGKDRTSEVVIKTQVFVDTGNQYRIKHTKPKKKSQ